MTDSDPLEVGRRLAAGELPGDVFLGLWNGGAEPRDAAIAVCVACGATPEEAERRIREFDDLWDFLEPGEEADGADLLTRHGYFRPDAVLDERQRIVLSRLHAAVDVVRGVPSGYAVGLFTRFRTGDLDGAYHHLERMGRRMWPDDQRFWAAMASARELLATDLDRTEPFSS
ncbi:hypothetical protein [Actinoplanes sp. G11-F43]|uniref:hypothetical protein n=1 Tax=Actinoplanes sp. G11-F43 TaxID=3424130 RepID=UPI003D33A5C5